jgi:lysophospholipase L1-like esterase
MIRLFSTGTSGCFVTVMVAATLGSAIGVPAEPLAIQDRQQIFMLGDSLTEGEDPDGYVNTTRLILAQLYPDRTYFIANAGKGGDTAIEMSDRLDRDVLRFKPDWVTFSVGVNDINRGFSERSAGDDPRGVSLPLFQEKVRSIIQRIQDRGAKVVLFSGTVIKEDLSSVENQKMERYSNALRQIAAEKHCILADTRRAFRDALTPLQKPAMPHSGILTGDGVHMKFAGSWLMAKTLVQAWGAPAKEIERVKPAVEVQIRQQYEKLNLNLACFKEANYKLHSPSGSCPRVVYIGAGFADQQRLADAFPNVEHLNRGISGETTRQLRMRFHQDVVALKPKAAVIFLGACDDFRPEHRMSLIDTESHLARIARLAKGSGIRLGIAAVLPANASESKPKAGLRAPWLPVDAVPQLNQWIEQHCRENGYVFIDCDMPVADSQGKLKHKFTDDGINLNSAGRTMVQPALKTAIEELTRN